MHEYTEEYTYDDKDRIVMVVRKAGEYEEYGDKSEYTYNAEGWLSEELEYELEGGEWMLVNKYTYEYDADGHMVLSQGYFYDEGWQYENKMTFEYEGGLLRNDIYFYYDEEEGWVPNTRNDYICNAQGLCIAAIANNWEGEWVESYKHEYEYDAVGNCISATESSHYELEDWMFSTRIEYAYDANNNCTNKATYYYESELEEWVLEYTMFYTYDLSVPVGSTAGIFMVWDDELPIYNKVLNWQVQYDDVAESTVLFYSGCEGLDETAESRLSVWPNPTSDVLNLNAEGLQQVEIFTLNGQQVAVANSGFESIGVSHLAAIS
ncbi:MAG: T9SS type A sorting domain-containing protein [Bacteroidales bacterium]|nr:T9SS type A sorting domain-containing protein [Bacteroidales bacterium]